jgi:hypothetical protein
LRTIRDPEKPNTLEDLKVVYEDGIFVQKPTDSNVIVVRIEFNPTVPHCSLATLIGLKFGLGQRRIDFLFSLIL